jgi:hypothetical protein
MVLLRRPSLPLPIFFVSTTCPYCPIRQRWKALLLGKASLDFVNEKLTFFKSGGEAIEETMPRVVGDFPWKSFSERQRLYEHVLGERARTGSHTGH